LSNIRKGAEYALFGGSFDPVHLGHIEIVKKALKIVDKVIVVPTFLNPFKSHFAANPETRLNWCKEAFDFENVIVSDFEIKNAKPTFTIETFNALSKDYNIKYIIIGADNLKSITKWARF